MKRKKYNTSKIPHCQHCDKEKELFVISRTPKGRPCYMCKTCNTERIRKYRNTKIGKKNIYKAVKKSIKKYQYKQDARNILHYKINRREIIVPNKCEICKSKCKPQGHHKDYLEPLEVMWVCRNCHCKMHKNHV